MTPDDFEAEYMRRMRAADREFLARFVVPVAAVCIVAGIAAVALLSALIEAML